MQYSPLGDPDEFPEMNNIQIPPGATIYETGFHWVKFREKNGQGWVAEFIGDSWELYMDDAKTVAFPEFHKTYTLDELIKNAGLKTK